MAAATVATSVAPVFALESQNVEEKALISEVEKKLAVKYSDEKLGSVYEVKVTLKKGTNADTPKPITTVAELKELLEKAEVEGKSITVDITDKGHETTADGKIVDTTVGTKFTSAELAAISEDNKVIKKVDRTTIRGKTIVTLGSGIELILDQTTARLDFNSGLDAAGNPINIAGIASNDDETAKRVVGFKVDKTYSADELYALETSSAATGVILSVSKLQKDGTTAATGASDIYKVKLTLASGKTVELDLNSEKLDLSKGLDASGNEATAPDSITSFAKSTATAKLAAKNEAQLVCNAVVSQKLQYKLDTFKTENGYTQAGKELVELLGDANSDPNHIATTIKDGKRYKVKFVNTNNLELSPVKDGGYQLTIDLMVAEGNKDLPDSANIQLVISSNVQKDLDDLKTVLSNRKATDEDITIEKYEVLSGDTRFETAVEISKKAYGTNGAADAIVLVGENAVVDGLASAPLAAEKKAPILLTKKDSIPASTLAEIKRVAAKGSEVYLIGGENTISKAVQTQLEKEIGAKVLRVAGEDRYETSLKIAEELDLANKTTKFNKAYVVGGDGLADAMSVAAVAAQEVQPIIVSPATGLTKDAVKFLDEQEDIAKSYVVGGTTKVSTQVLKDIIAIKNKDQAIEVKRIAGENRNDTNAKVISTLAGASISEVYVAKDGDAQLVDALAAAPLAASKSAPIVLATNDLIKSQADAIDAKKATTGQQATQIGNGVASTVMQKVLKALGK